MKLSKSFCSLQMLTPGGLEAVDCEGKGTMCDQVTCERIHHQGEVTPAGIRTQLSRLVSAGTEPEAPSEGFPPRKFIFFSNDYNRNLRKLPIKPGML